MLQIALCRLLCDWVRGTAPYDAAVLLACTGCGSQWEPGQQWTPSQSDGTVPPAVLDLRAKGQRG